MDSSPVKRTRSWLPQDDMAAASRGAVKLPSGSPEGENAVITVSPPPRPLAAATAAKSPLSEKAERCAEPMLGEQRAVRGEKAYRRFRHRGNGAVREKAEIHDQLAGGEKLGLHLLAVDAEKAEIPAIVSGAVHAEKAFSCRPRGDGRDARSVPAEEREIGVVYDDAPAISVLIG